MGLARPHAQPPTHGPPRPEVTVLVVAASGAIYAAETPEWPPGLPYPRPRDESIRFQAEVMTDGDNFNHTGFELTPAPLPKSPDPMQPELFKDDYSPPDLSAPVCVRRTGRCHAQADAADGEPVFGPGGGAEMYPDDNCVQAE